MFTDGVPYMHGQMFFCGSGERMPERFPGQPLSSMIRGCQILADVCSQELSGAEAVKIHHTQCYINLADAFVQTNSQ